MVTRSGMETNRIDKQTVTAVATDGNGSFDVTFSGLSSVGGKDSVEVTAVIYSYYQDQNTYVELPQVGGFDAFPGAVSGNTVTFYLMYDAYTTNGNLNSFPFENTGAGFIPLPSQTNIANVYARAMGA